MTPTVLVAVVSIVGKLIPIAAEIAEAVTAAMADGELSAEEAEAAGRALGMSAGPALDVRINGHDVIHGPALALIGGGLARIARQVVIARRG